MLHAVYRVGDMDTTIEYYKKHFGMKLLRYRDIPDVRGGRPGKQCKHLAMQRDLIACCPAARTAARTSYSEPNRSRVIELSKMLPGLSGS